MNKRLADITQEEEANIDLTPMLDVVFIMLIFFIVTASFVKESGIDVNKPEAQTAVKKDRANIFVGIDKNDQIWIDKRRVDVRSVAAVLERLHAENPKGSVVIQADEDSTNKSLVKVMDAARSVGIVNVAMAAEN